VCQAWLLDLASKPLLLLLLPQILLDFDGHTTEGTKYNTQFFAGLPFDTPAYDVDGNTSE
jgi:hypothetical protein